MDKDLKEVIEELERAREEEEREGRRMKKYCIGIEFIDGTSEIYYNNKPIEISNKDGMISFKYKYEGNRDYLPMEVAIPLVSIKKINTQDYKSNM